MAKLYSVFARLFYYCFLSRSTRPLRYLFLGRAAIFSTIEWIKPARDIEHRSFIVFDLLTWAASVYLFGPAAEVLTRTFPGYPMLPHTLAALPTPVRVLAYFVIGDFGNYWAHRLLHTRYFWQAHKWHHSPKHMYWLAGMRASIPQLFITNLGFLLAVPFLVSCSLPVIVACAITQAFSNDWMHLNFAGRSRWLETFLVTPRYHHVHHSECPEHFNKNMGAIFSIWDRMFGTYYDPDQVIGDLTFGVSEKEDLVRMVVGI